MDIKLTFSYFIWVGLAAFSFTVQLIYPSDKSSAYEVVGRRGGGTKFKMKRKRKAKKIGINIRKFMNRNFGIFKIERGFM